MKVLDSKLILNSSSLISVVGNAEGVGNVRKEELYRACVVLKVSCTGARYSSWIVILISSSFLIRFHILFCRFRSNMLKSWITQSYRLSLASNKTCKFINTKYMVLDFVVTNATLFQDGFNNRWDHKLLSTIIEDEIKMWDIDSVRSIQISEILSEILNLCYRFICI